ncbi:RNA polymerase sigma factor [Geminicoccaceae bacterium 1502E]|nr:RNA polymerase sigma factor [Geminicoccaceae bacterium 1502E]
MPRERLEACLDRLYGYALSLTQDPEQARDLVQECAVKALAARRVPADQAACRAWLFRILRNAFIDSRRRPRLVALEEAGEDGPHSADGVPLADERLINVLTVRTAMARLPEAHREVVALIDIGGLSYAEAAQVLGVAEGTVMSRLSRARAALLRLIAEAGPRVVPAPATRAVS